MTSLRHKDYIATIEADEGGGFFHGEVINTRTVLTFQGRSLDELKHEFSETIAVYEEWRQKRGKEPERPYSGSLTLRMPPDLHRRVAEAAARSGKSLNGFIKDTLEHATWRASAVTSLQSKILSGQNNFGSIPLLIDLVRCSLNGLSISVQHLARFIGVDPDPQRGRGN